MFDPVILVAREVFEKFAEWVTEHMGRAIWVIFIFGLLLIFTGAVFSEVVEWRETKESKDGTVWEMFSEQPFDKFSENLFIQTLNPIGIEVVGAVIVAVAFLLLRDTNREKMEALERKIDDLQASQCRVEETLGNLQTRMADEARARAAPLPPYTRRAIRNRPGGMHRLYRR